MAVVKTYQSTSYIGKEGVAPIYVYFYIQREKVVIACNVSTKIEYYDKKSGKVSKQDKEYKDKNLMIEKVLSRVNDVMVRYRLRNRNLTRELFLSEYNRPDDFKTFFEYIEYYQKEHPKELRLSTSSSHKVVIDKLKSYAPNLHCEQINNDFLTKYRTFLQKESKNGESTINKNMAVIKKYVRAAMKSGYIDGNPFEEIKIKRSVRVKNPVFLTEDELRILIDLYKKNTLTKTQKSVLQFFLFQCLSSLHITDAKQLKIEQISSKSFAYLRQKTGGKKPEPIIVPLSSPAKALIKKIKGLRVKGPLFVDMIADQKINENLKTIASIAEINKPISSATGRHTFATIFYRNTKDIYALKEIMGHSDIRETLIYMHLVNEDKQKGIATFNNFKL